MAYRHVIPAPILLMKTIGGHGLRRRITETVGSWQCGWTDCSPDRTLNGAMSREQLPGNAGGFLEAQEAAMTSPILSSVDSSGFVLLCVAPLPFGSLAESGIFTVAQIQGAWLFLASKTRLPHNCKQGETNFGR
jgi:hypothetical protein